MLVLASVLVLVFELVSLLMLVFASVLVLAPELVLISVLLFSVLVSTCELTLFSLDEAPVSVGTASTAIVFSFESAAS